MSQENRLYRPFEFRTKKSQNIFDLERVAFHYSSDRKFSLQNLNLGFSPGGWIGLTGPVGSGKSTFLELLSRQRDPNEGDIYYRGAHLKSISPEKVAESILYVPQETFMFSRSIRKNLELGVETRFPDSELWQLLKDLSFDEELLETRGGLDIRLGERGVNLSGGQKQRLSIGRALLRKRDVYLFDDLFSHVDTETEAKILRSLEARIPSGATVILVSQRIATLSRCRDVLVLNANGVEFFGPPQLAYQKSPFVQQLQILQEAAS